jgi:hypothetical protein
MQCMRTGKYRYALVLLLFMAGAINHMDRAALGIWSLFCGLTAAARAPRRLYSFAQQPLRQHRTGADRLHDPVPERLSQRFLFGTLIYFSGVLAMLLADPQPASRRRRHRRAFVA